MLETQVTSRLDQLEEEIGEMRERLGRYRRAMLGSRVAVLGGLATLVGVYALMPAFATGAVVVTAIVCVIGGTVWLGATNSSSQELATALERAEAEKAALFDGVAARNGWFDPASRPAPSSDRRRLPLR